MHNLQDVPITLTFRAMPIEAAVGQVAAAVRSLPSDVEHGLVMLAVGDTTWDLTQG